MIKLICLDIDGTLLNTQRELTPRVIEAIRLARAKGITVTIASGRIHQSVMAIAHLAGINAPIISMNGSLIRDMETGRVYKDIPIGQETIFDVYKILKELKARPNFYDKNCMYISSRFAAYRQIYGPIKTKYPLDYVEMEDYAQIERVLKQHGHGVNKIIFFPGREKQSETAGAFAGIPEISLVSSSRSNLEITNVMADKGKAVISLGEFVGARPEEIMCVGDERNDISMLTAVKYSVAMGNAPDEVKQAVAMVTLDNDHDGCAIAIEKLALEMD